MPKMTDVVGHIVQSNAYLEDNQEALRKSFIELHKFATRQHDRIEELEGLLREAMEELDGPPEKMLPVSGEFYDRARAELKDDDA